MWLKMLTNMIILLMLLVFQTTPHSLAVETTEVDVLILGGGISGVTAANYLDNNGVKNFLLLEAQDYIGGRLKNLTVGNTTISEGANWISFVEEGRCKFGLQYLLITVTHMP